MIVANPDIKNRREACVWKTKILSKQKKKNQSGDEDLRACSDGFKVLILFKIFSTAVLKDFEKARVNQPDCFDQMFAWKLLWCYFTNCRNWNSEQRKLHWFLLVSLKRVILTILTHLKSFACSLSSFVINKLPYVSGHFLQNTLLSFGRKYPKAFSDNQVIVPRRQLLLSLMSVGGRLLKLFQCFWNFPRKNKSAAASTLESIETVDLKTTRKLVCIVIFSVKCLYFWTLVIGNWG